MRLILASASPRRAELLAAAGYRFEVCATDVDERLLEGERPEVYVRRLAIGKSAAALERISRPAEGGCRESAGRRGLEARQKTTDAIDGGDDRRGRDGTGEEPVIIVAADTAVIVDNRILGKPADRADAERMLRLLSGRAHEVLTGVSVRSVRRQLDHVESTRVLFSPLSDEEVAWYVSSGEGADKAGAYAIQGLASRFVPRIEGSYGNVVGLPVARVARLIRMLD
jgi:septum formation protein